ncbi:MAG TPA: CHASE3 domain-containing protein [Hyphomonadaceae bacterium]|jgi:signal transduction histidine kinase/CheY-like chemotaxis protein|nr:CHASE3 domain-containing protein [Hyphomonadaceae bacterium]
MPAVAGLSILATVVGAIVFALIYQTQATWVTHTLEVERELGRLRGTLQVGEIASRNFILSRDEAFASEFNSASIEAPKQVERIAELTADNPAQQGRIAELRSLVRQNLDVTLQAIGARRAGNADTAMSTFVSGPAHEISEKIEATVTQMDHNEADLLATREAEALSSGTTLISAGALTVLLAIVSLILWLQDRRRSNAALQSSLAEQQSLVANLQTANDATQRETGLKLAAEMKLRQIQKMEAVGQLTGGIAHDFNNMLSVIMSAITLSRKRLKAGNYDVNTMMDAAMDAAQRAAKLTARLLAFSRQQPLAPEPLDAGKFIGGMTELLQRTLGEHIQVETVLGAGLWRMHVDISQLENAVINLAVNARDAMQKGGKLTLETANTSLDDAYAREHADVTAGQYVMIAVSDSGEGMPAHVIERAFDPFFTTKPVGVGTGLGLSQVFGFVKQSGGHVKIYSELGSGTTVKVYLPRYFGDKPEAMRASALPEDLRTEPVSGVILVVEDEPRLREVGSTGLRDLGYTILEAPNGTEALKILDANPSIQLLFTDIVMPDMTGRVLADEALKRRPDLKVLYTTGYTRNAVVHNGVLDHGVNFLPKPFTLEELARKVREVLAKA